MKENDTLESVKEELGIVEGEEKGTDLVKAEGAEIETAETETAAEDEESAVTTEGAETAAEEPTSEGAAVPPVSSPEGEELDKKKKLILFGAIGVAVVTLAVILIIIFSGKGSNDKGTVDNIPTATVEPTPEVTASPVPTATPTPTPTLVPTQEPVEPEETPTPSIDEILAMHETAGEMQSYINGNWVAKEVGMQRPYCMMFNNIAVANPQSGTSCADILYEILVEGNITRLMGVFENLTDESSCKDRMGSVRSARHYYASIASEYDAIFIHFGETTYATKKIKQLGLDHLEGTYAEGSTVFYRDKNIKAPHNAFATLEGIHKAIANKKFRTEHKEDFVSQHFDFAYPENGLNSIEKAEQIPDQTGETADNTDDETEILPATLVKIPFSSYAQPYLTYDEETKLYKRYQFNGEHIDYNTNEVLTFNNIIIQLVQESNRDKNGYQDIEGYGDRDGHHNPVSGKGYYICEGKCIEITWSKNEAKYECNYYTLDGERLVMRPGKTFIAVFPSFREDKIEIQ